MKKPAIIIFVRNPLSGQVKTRLAKIIGQPAALEVYKKLLVHTKQVTQHLQADVFVYYADFINPKDIWNGVPYTKKLQVPGTLGDRMQQAFSEVLKEYDKAVIIGSDCYDLSSEIIQQAIIALNSNPVVIGPSLDGGYYLLGMTRLVPGIFANINWSTDSVFTETEAVLQQQGLSLYLLPVLSDVDTAEDYYRYPALQ